MICAANLNGKGNYHVNLGDNNAIFFTVFANIFILSYSYSLYILPTPYISSIINI